MIIALSLLVALIGLVMYLVASNPKISRIGEIMLFAGLLAFLMLLPGHPFGVIAK